MPLKPVKKMVAVCN